MQKLEHHQVLEMLATRQMHILDGNSSPLGSWLRDAWTEAGALSRAVARSDGQASSAALVVIWRALLSEWIDNIPEDQNITDAAGLFMATMYDSNYWKPEQDKALQAHTNVLVLIDAFAHLASANMFNAKVLERIMALLDVSWTQLMALYLEGEPANLRKITFTRETREELRRAYVDAVAHGKADFQWDGHAFVTAYAGYLLEFLDTKEL